MYVRMFIHIGASQTVFAHMSFWSLLCPSPHPPPSLFPSLSLSPSLPPSLRPSLPPPSLPSSAPATKRYEQRYLSFVSEQPPVKRDIIAALMQRNAEEFVAHQEWEWEWNRAGLASRLTEEVGTQYQAAYRHQGSCLPSCTFYLPAARVLGVPASTFSSTPGCTSSCVLCTYVRTYVCAKYYVRMNIVLSTLHN